MGGSNCFNGYGMVPFGSHFHSPCPSLTRSQGITAKHSTPALSGNPVWRAPARPGQAVVRKMESAVAELASNFFSFLLLLLLVPYSVQLQHAEDSWHFQCVQGYLDVLIIHRTLTWTTGSLTRVSLSHCDHFACVYTQGASDYSLIRRTSCSRVCT